MLELYSNFFFGFLDYFLIFVLSTLVSGLFWAILWFISSGIWILLGYVSSWIDKYENVGVKISAVISALIAAPLFILTITSLNVNGLQIGRNSGFLPEYM